MKKINSYELPKKLIIKLTELFNNRKFQEIKKEIPILIKTYPESFFLWNIKGAVEVSMGDSIDAIKSFKTVIEINPNYSDAHNNLGIILQKNGDLKEAIKSYERALNIEPKYPECLNNLGVTYKELEKYDSAIRCYKKAIGLDPNYFEAYNNLAVVYQLKGDLDLAIKNFQNAINLNSTFSKAISQMLHLKRYICDWTNDDEVKKYCSTIGLQGQAIPPFSALSLEDNPENQMKRSINFANEKFKGINQKPFKNISFKVRKIRVGYFSSDFYNHATSYLISGLLRHHDKNNFEIYIYNYGTSKADNWSEKIKKNANLFEDISMKSDNQIVRLVRKHELDIAIDLKGYTQNTRNELFSYRLAPLQVSFLGYPSTLGTKFIDYLIADKILIPKDYRKYYTEKILYLPDTYQPNDNQRFISKSQTKRIHFGLPEDAFVFCCFNNNYKITSSEFDIWMRVLKRIDKSVLWLLKSNKWSEKNLKKQAILRGVDDSRVIFAEKLLEHDHLERHKHADLFIDTFNCNAHTTASDALWSGLPVVTKIGHQFAARVCSSLLNSVGLKELITNNEKEYENLLTELANDIDKVNKLKTNLLNNLRTCAMFNTTQYTKNFEHGLKIMYENKNQGSSPKDIII